jgi:hypothetical protein
MMVVEYLTDIPHLKLTHLVAYHKEAVGKVNVHGINTWQIVVIAYKAARTTSRRDRSCPFTWKNIKQRVRNYRFTQVVRMAM